MLVGSSGPFGRYMYSRKAAKIVYSKVEKRIIRNDCTTFLLQRQKAKGKRKDKDKTKKRFLLARTRMYQVGTRYLGNCWTSYVCISLRVLTLVRIPFTLPYLTDLLGRYLPRR